MKHTVALSLIAMLVAPLAIAQTGTDPVPSVTISGQRGATNDSRLITAAKSKVLSRNFASGCNYMSAFSAAEDDVTQAYMNNFGLQDSLSNEGERIRENSPNGDVSTETIPVTPGTTEVPSGTTPSAGCGNADRNFAVGRNRIARKDTSLAEAFAAYDNKDYAKAMAQAKVAYNKVGYDEAALLLARLNLYGLGTPKNSEQAITWLKKVTEARFDPMRDVVKFDPRDPEAMTPRVEANLTLAKIYLRGTGTPKNAAEANKWFAKAVETGFTPANNTLGMAAMSGFGGPRDVRKAAAYFKTAAEAGYVPAEYNLAKLYYNGDDGVPQDYKQAGAWFNAAAKTGHAGALFAAGRMYDMGQGVAADPKKAIVYYKEAALKDNADAQAALATFFYTGEVVQKDLGTARKLFLAAAKHGQPDAMFNMGVMSMNGEAGTKDLATAYVWFTLAQQSGNESAAGALKQLAPTLSKADLARADAVLKPKS
jgi:hypothetical protein